jgi:hypothetical protein
MIRRLLAVTLISTLMTMLIPPPAAAGWETLHRVMIELQLDVTHPEIPGADVLSVRATMSWETHPRDATISAVRSWGHRVSDYPAGGYYAIDELQSDTTAPIAFIIKPDLGRATLRWADGSVVTFHATPGAYSINRDEWITGPKFNTVYPEPSRILINRETHMGWATGTIDGVTFDSREVPSGLPPYIERYIDRRLMPASAR